MKQIFNVVACLLFLSCKAQDSSVNTEESKPKLVIGIVVDQMRYDYLTRFEGKFGEGGFMRLINDGFNCKNHHFNYVPTYTGPGHASVFTGTSPMNHGIISNYWYDKFIDKTVYCASDDSVTAVGVVTEKEKMSPRRMKTTTVADELKLHTQNRSKVIGISLKDRGAILPAGHSANAAYWFRGKDDGKFITSTYYSSELPKWVQKFNTTTKSYLKIWNTMLPIDQYTESGPDNTNFEESFKGKDTPTFPYNLKELSKENGGYDILKATPFGNEMTTDFAIAAIENEALGADDITDFLTVSYSSTDYVGHQFGVNSVEVEDTYIRLDKDLEKLLQYLDKQVGEGKYTVFLTADHGAVNVPNYLKSQHIPAGYFNKKEFTAKVKEALVTKFEFKGLVKNISNNQIFLNRELIKKHNLNLIDIQEFLAQDIVLYKHIDKAYSAKTLSTTQFVTGVGVLVQNGFHQKHSGDVVFVLEPAVISYPEKGSTHGSSFSYDTHVPLLFYGAGINKGASLTKTEVIDIAPTISALLGISFPNGCTGNPLGFVLDVK
ncbi:MAG: alkaline phosphatase family protein [Flavobacteriaceae bacterium]|nr:alkaline phosphatase family protein [Flavobacteriaceae bacterium]